MIVYCTMGCGSKGCTAQVTLLSEGNMVYFGPPEKAVGWFSSLGFRYEQWRDGAESDWLIDLVSVSFHKPEVSSCQAAAGHMCA